MSVYETGWLPLEGHAIFHVNRTVPVGYYPVTEEDRKCVGWNIEDGCGSDQISNATISIVLERHTLECKAYTTMYQVDIAYEKGIQHTAQEQEKIFTLELMRNSSGISPRMMRCRMLRRRIKTG